MDYILKATNEVKRIEDAGKPPPVVLGEVEGEIFTENDVSALVQTFLETHRMNLNKAIGLGYIVYTNNWHWLTQAGLTFHRNAVLADLPPLDLMPTYPTQALYASGLGFVDIPDSHLQALIHLNLPIEESVELGYCKLTKSVDGKVAGEIRFTDVLKLAQSMAVKNRGATSSG